MKKLVRLIPLFGFLIAVVLVCVTSSFKNAEKTNSAMADSYVWFKISGNHAPGTAVQPQDAEYLDEGTVPPTSVDCNTGTTNQCISGFNADQVTSADELDGNQTPQQTPYTRD